MAVINLIAEFFLYSVGLGLSGFSFLANTKEMGAGFLKLVSSIVGASIVLAFFLHWSYASWRSPQAILYGVCIASTALTYFFHKEKKTFLMWGLYVLQVASLVLLLFIAHNEYVKAFTYFLSSAALLGVVTYAMVMGHWYLVTPKLSEKPLLRATLILWAVLIGKIIVTGYGVTQHLDLFEEGTRLAGGYSFNWLMIIMRVVWGYVVVGVMSIFGWKLIKMRSIQSATGILYAMTFFVFVGEMISIYLFYNYGLYL